MRILGFIVFSLLLQTAAASPKITLVIDLDGVLISEAQEKQRNPIGKVVISANNGKTYYALTHDLENLEALIDSKKFEIVIWSAGTKERNEFITKNLKLPDSKKSLYAALKGKVYSRENLVQVPASEEAERPLEMNTFNQVENKNIGKKDLSVVSGQNWSNTFIFDDNGKYIRRGQEENWIPVGPGEDRLTIAIGNMLAKKVGGVTIGEIVGGVELSREVSFRPKSLGPSLWKKDYFLELSDTEYQQVRDLVALILTKYPSDKWHYVFLGRSPTPLGRFLENVDPRLSSFVPYSGGHLDGEVAKNKDITAWAYRILNKTEEAKLMHHFERFFPSKEKLDGKNVLVVDYFIPEYNEGLPSFFSYLRKFLKDKNINVKGLGLLDIDSESKESIELYGFKVDVIPYDERYSDVQFSMKKSAYEAVAPFGRFIPSQDRSENLARRHAYELFGYRIFEKMKTDRQLKGFLGSELYDSFLARRSELSQLEAYQRDISLIHEEPRYIFYMLDTLNTLPTQERQEILRFVFLNLANEIAVGPRFGDYVVPHLLPEDVNFIFREMAQTREASLADKSVLLAGYRHLRDPELIQKVLNHYRDSEDLHFILQNIILNEKNPKTFQKLIKMAKDSVGIVMDREEMLKDIEDTKDLYLEQQRRLNSWRTGFGGACYLQFAK